MKKYYIILIVCTVFSSCKKFLDEKSNKKLVVPASLQDAQALLDNYSLLNGFYPSLGAQSDDDFYLLDTYSATLSTVNKNNYVWAREATNDIEWGYLYQMALNANLALETVESIVPDRSNVADWNRIKGASLFFRSFAFYHVAQYYAVPYDKSTASQTPGIPLRLSSDINPSTTRSDLQHTYEQITGDLKQAAALLPLSNISVSRPTRAAAFAALSKTYLAMEEYTLAGLYADSALQLNNALIDYNSLIASASFPFTRFNSEVIFPAIMIAPGMINVSNWKADSVLYQSYSANDIRKTIFYQSNGTGTFGFKGSYDGSTSRFCGIATDEMYLTRAECKARSGNFSEAISDLNTLLVKRWKTGTFIPYTATSADDALVKILSERRKELVLRGIRWIDLRRLNKDPRFAKTLIRKVSAQVYQLPPNDPRYTNYIPQSVINVSGIQQNQR